MWHMGKATQTKRRITKTMTKSVDSPIWIIWRWERWDMNHTYIVEYYDAQTLEV